MIRGAAGAFCGSWRRDRSFTRASKPTGPSCRRTSGRRMRNLRRGWSGAAAVPISTTPPVCSAGALWRSARRRGIYIVPWGNGRFCKVSALTGRRGLAFSSFDETKEEKETKRRKNESRGIPIFPLDNPLVKTATQGPRPRCGEPQGIARGEAGADNGIFQRTTFSPYLISSPNAQSIRTGRTPGRPACLNPLRITYAARPCNEWPLRLTRFAAHSSIVKDSHRI